MHLRALILGLVVYLGIWMLAALFTWNPVRRRRCFARSRSRHMGCRDGRAGRGAHVARRDAASRRRRQRRVGDRRALLADADAGHRRRGSDADESRRQSDTSRPAARLEHACPALVISMVIKGYRVGPLLKKTIREIGEDNVTTLAASAAYNFFFSLFPLLLFLTPLLSLVGDKQQMVGLADGAARRRCCRPTQVEAIRPILDKVVFSPNAPGLMSVGLVLAAWSGSNIFGTLMGALNTAYDVNETRSWIKQQLIRLLRLRRGGVIMVAVDDRLPRRRRRRELDRRPAPPWRRRRFSHGRSCSIPLARRRPRRARLHDRSSCCRTCSSTRAMCSSARCVTTLLWIVATLLFRLYVSSLSAQPAYGLIGGVIILLTWMYYTMFVVLVGGELASELHHGTGAIARTRARSTSGESSRAPAGKSSVERSVVSADRGRSTTRAPTHQLQAPAACRRAPRSR